MKTEQYIITNCLLQGTLGAQADLVLLFGATKRIKEKGLIDIVRAAYPKACFFGCTTSGEIMVTQVLDNSLIVTAVSFSSTRVRGAMVKVTSIEDSYKAGSELAKNKKAHKACQTLNACRAPFLFRQYRTSLWACYT